MHTRAFFNHKTELSKKTCFTWSQWILGQELDGFQFKGEFAEGFSIYIPIPKLQVLTQVKLKYCHLSSEVAQAPCKYSGTQVTQQPKSKDFYVKNRKKIRNKNEIREKMNNKNKPALPQVLFLGSFILFLPYKRNKLIAIGFFTSHLIRA